MTKLFKSSIYGTFYFFNKSKREEQNDLVRANPDLNLTLELWNLMENKYIAQAMEIILPPILVNQLIFIPMIDL